MSPKHAIRWNTSFLKAVEWQVSRYMWYFFNTSTLRKLPYIHRQATCLNQSHLCRVRWRIARCAPYSTIGFMTRRPSFCRLLPPVVLTWVSVFCHWKVWDSVFVTSCYIQPKMILVWRISYTRLWHVFQHPNLLFGLMNIGESCHSKIYGMVRVWQIVHLLCCFDCVSTQW